MKMMNFRIFLFAALICTALTSCFEDDDDNGAYGESLIKPRIYE